MSTEQQADPIDCLLVCSGQLTLLIPSLAVADVIDLPQLQALPQAPPWVGGWALWNDQQVPVLDFEAMQGEREAVIPQQEALLVILKNGRVEDYQHYAVIACGAPRPLTVSAQDQWLGDVSPVVAPGLQMAGRYGGERLLLPDFDEIEQRVAQIPDVNH